MLSLLGRLGNQRTLTTHTAAMSTYARLVRFIPTSSSTPLIGEPVDATQDVGVASYNSEPVEVEVFSGNSILNPGERTGKKELVERLLSPLSQDEVGTIRCIGLNARIISYPPRSHGLMDFPVRSPRKRSRSCDPRRTRPLHEAKHFACRSSSRPHGHPPSVRQGQCSGLRVRARRSDWQAVQERF
jgi:hypothetical protein